MLAQELSNVKGKIMISSARRNVGTSERRNVETSERRNVGTSEGWNVGTLEGRNVGRLEGRNVGRLEGRNVGTSEGRGREMGTFKRFEEIEAWKTAREITKAVYQLTSRGDFSRDFGLKDQMRRAAVSIMSNIAEGYESRTEILFLELLGRAKGSSGELRAQFYVVQDAGYAPMKEVASLQDACSKCSGQIGKLMDHLRRSNGRNS